MNHDHEYQKSVFIALKIPATPAIQLGAAARMLEIALRDTVPVHRERDPHLTLRYLGDTSTHQIEQLISIWIQLQGGVPPRFHLRLDTIGAFPNLHSPTFVWAGVTGDTEALRETQAHIDQAATSLGMRPADFSFTPHITIARIEHQPLSKQQEDKVRNVVAALKSNPPFHQAHRGWTVTAVTALAQTEGRPDGRYRTVLETRLRQT